MVFNTYELKVYSQNGEDGLLLYIFSQLGMGRRCFVEIGSGNGAECNSANLAIHFGWQGSLFDASKENIDDARVYYQKALGIKPFQVKAVQCFFTAENINQVLEENSLAGSIDLLSIDVDGNDYWLWRALKVIEPRVVVIEYNASLGPNRALATRYDPDFDRDKKHPSGFYHGASLAALAKLANDKGYILVGCESKGVNAFFVQRDIAKGKMAEVEPGQAYYQHLGRLKKMSTADQFSCIKHLEFVEV